MKNLLTKFFDAVKKFDNSFQTKAEYMEQLEQVVQARVAMEEILEEDREEAVEGLVEDYLNDNCGKPAPAFLEAKEDFDAILEGRGKRRVVRLKGNDLVC